MRDPLWMEGNDLEEEEEELDEISSDDAHDSWYDED